MNTRIFNTIFVLLLITTGCQKQADTPPPVRPVRAVTVQSTDTDEQQTLSGTIQSHQEIKLAFRLSGKLISRQANIGDMLGTGQLVATLDGEVQQDALKAAQAQFDSAVAVLEQSQNNEKRLRDLVNEKAVSRSDYENALRQQKTAQEQVNSAKAQLNSAQKQVQYTRLTAPSAGLVTQKWAEPGEVVTAGQPIITIAGLQDWDVVIDAPASLIRKGLQKGQRVSVWLTGNPAIKSTASIREISPVADPLTHTYTIRARLQDKADEFLLGSTVSAQIQLPVKRAISLPDSALTQVGDQPAVWVIDPDTSTVKLREVTIDSYTENTVLISSGLNTSEQVVTGGTQLLHQGQKVRTLGAQQ